TIHSLIKLRRGHEHQTHAKANGKPRMLIFYFLDRHINHRDLHSFPTRRSSDLMKHVNYIACFNDLDQHWAAIGDLIAPQGAIVAIVGNRNPLPQDAVRAKSAALCWELMFTRARFQTPDMIEQHRLLDRVADWLDAGRLRGTL